MWGLEGDLVRLQSGVDSGEVRIVEGTGPDEVREGEYREILMSELFSGRVLRSRVGK